MTLTPQQRWNQRNPEKRKESDKKRQSENQQFTLRLNKTKDAKLIAWLQAKCKEQDMTAQEVLKHLVTDACFRKS